MLSRQQARATPELNCIPGHPLVNQDEASRFRMSPYRPDNAGENVTEINEIPTSSAGEEVLLTKIENNDKNAQHGDGILKA